MINLMRKMKWTVNTSCAAKSSNLAWLRGLQGLLLTNSNQLETNEKNFKSIPTVQSPVQLWPKYLNLIQFWSQLTCLAHFKETGSRFYFEDISHISFILIYLSPLWTSYQQQGWNYVLYVTLYLAMNVSSNLMIGTVKW